MREEKHVHWVACCYQAGRGNTGLTEVVKEATKPPFPGELKGTNRAVEKKINKSHGCVCRALADPDSRQMEQ